MREIILCLVLTWLATSVIAQDKRTHDMGHHNVHSVLAVSVAWDRAGRLWRASVKGGRVLVDASDDQGKIFSSPVIVNSLPEKIGAEGEQRPKIAIGPEGNLYVSWTQLLPKPYAGHIRFSSSIDGGKSFSAPIIVNHDHQEITHRFDALTVTSDARVWVAWIDKRDLLAAKVSGQPYDGAAIYYAVSTDAGASFTIERKASDNSCECCRIAMLPTQDNSVVAMWRQLFPGGIRDHAIGRLDTSQPTQVHRASFGNWKIDACPHHGPALARGNDWGWHMAWYDGGDKHGLYYARVDGSTWVSTPARRFGDIQAQAGHPTLLSQGDRVWLAWKELTEKDTVIRLARSEDGGRNWSDHIEIARAEDATDYPYLINNGTKVYLSWNTTQNYRLVLLDDTP